MNKISVIMSVYNESINDLRKSIESICNQTYSNLEFIIIVDNPNNKEIVKFIEAYRDLDSRIKVAINEKNIGLANSLNLGISMSTGEYIARMDADDISLSDRLEKQIKYLTDNKLDIVSTRVQYIDDHDNDIDNPFNIDIYGPKSVKKALKYGNVLNHPTWMFKKDVYKKINGYREFICAQDYDFILRAVDYGFRVDNANFIGLKYRLRQNSISSTKSILQLRSTLYIQRLQKERKKTCKDSFTIEAFEKDIITSKYNIKLQNCINDNKKIKECIKNKSFIVAIIKLLKNLIISKEYRKLYYNRLILMIISKHTKCKGVKQHELL